MAIDGLLFIVLLAVSFTAYTNALQIKIEKVNFDTDKELLKIDAKLRPVNGINLVDISVDLFKDITEPVYIESEVLYRTELASDYTRFLEGPAIAICDLYEKPQLNPFLSILMAKLTEFGNKMTSCPITKMKYDIVGFNMNSHTVPSFVPAGDYHFEIRVSRRMVNGDHQKLYTFDGDVRIEP